MKYLNFLFPITFFSILLVSFFLLLVAKRKTLKQPSLLIIVYLFYLFFAFLGIPILFYKLDPFYVTINCTNKIIIWKMLLCSGISLISLLLGAATCKFLFKERRGILKNTSKQTNLLFPLVIYAISFGFFLIYLFSLESIPLLEALKGTDKELIAISRYKATSYLSVSGTYKYHWISLFVHQFLPFLTYFFFATFLFRPNLKNKIIFISSFMLTFFAQIADAQKMPAVTFLTGLFIIFWSQRSDKPKTKALLGYLSLSLIVLILFYSLFMPLSSTLVNLVAPFRRAIVSQIASSYFYFEFFPKKHSFLLGRSFPNPAGLFPYKHYPLAIEMMDQRNPSLAEMGLSGNASTVFWAEIYANFGYLAIPIASLIVGFLISLIDFFFNITRTTILKTALFTWIVLYVSKLALTSLGTLLLAPYLFSVLSLAFLLKSAETLSTLLNRAKNHE